MQADHPLTRQEVIDRYKAMCEAYKLAPGQVWLGGGSALIIHGLRETTMDLDAGCTAGTMRVLEDNLKMSASRKTVSEGYIEDCMLLPIPEFDTDLHTEAGTTWEDLESIDGVRVYTLEACLRQKRRLLERLGREKDQKDIDAILAAMGGSE